MATEKQKGRIEGLREAMEVIRREAILFRNTSGECIKAIEALIQQATDTPAAAQEAVSNAEEYLRGKYGAYRGHYEWRALEEAFLAGCEASSTIADAPEVKALVEALKLARLICIAHGESHVKFDKALKPFEKGIGNE